MQGFIDIVLVSEVVRLGFTDCFTRCSRLLFVERGVSSPYLWLDI